MGYSPRGCTESDMTERLTFSLSHFQSFTYFINLTFQGSDFIHKPHHMKESVTEPLSPGMGTSTIS